VRQERGFVDLFCGAGGAGLGLKRAGLQPLLGVDKYSRAVEVYREAVGPAIQADVRDLNPLQVLAERPFLLWASPPCPPWSMGRKWRGLPMGFETEDGLLLLEPLRWAQALRPRWVIVENVGTLPEEAAEAVASRLREMGYVTRVLRLDARAWVPQSRDHALIVGGPVPIPNPTPLPVAPRFADIADGDGALPVEPRVLRHWVRHKFNVPIVTANDILPTVSTRAYHHRWTCIVYDGDGRYRFPTFKEAARAQGFQDDHPLHRLAAETSTVAWRLLGDAVPVPMAEALGRAVLMAEEAMVGSAASGPGG
jgi:site-specific DNA-cytosine methylase